MVKSITYYESLRWLIASYRCQPVISSPYCYSFEKSASYFGEKIVTGVWRSEFFFLPLISSLKLSEGAKIVEDGASNLNNCIRWKISRKQRFSQENSPHPSPKASQNSNPVKPPLTSLDWNLFRPVARWRTKFWFVSNGKNLKSGLQNHHCKSASSTTSLQGVT